MIMKKLLAFILCGITAASLMTGCGKEVEISDTSFTANDGSSLADNSSETPTEALVQPENVEIMNYTAPQKGDKIIEINFKDYGTVKFRLFPDYAEKGAENFIGLAEDGYYDGLKFHRIITDFMIQGGDPLGTGMGGKSLWGSSFDGGTDPHLIHLPGAVAYANSGTTSSNTSQFYIVTGKEAPQGMFDYYEKNSIKLFSDNAKELYKQYGGSPYLDGNYTVFGQVIDGLDVIFKIQYVATGNGDMPIDDVIMESVRVTEYDGEELRFHISDYPDFDDPATHDVDNFTEPQIGDEIIRMNIKDYGEVKIRLFPEYLSKASENFIQLAKQGYYDGLTFHRVINDFMIQGGDPLGNGTGGECVWGDKFDGGKYYNLVHVAGALAYANSGSTATDGSQFYIVTGDVCNDDCFTELKAFYGFTCSDKVMDAYKKAGYGYPYLDGNYTVFGQVIDGLDVIFEVQKTETDDSDKPLNDVIIESMTVEEYDGSEIKWFISDYDSDNNNNEETDNTNTDTEEETTENNGGDDTEPSAE